MRQGGLLLTSVLLAHSGMPTADIGVYETLLYVGSVLSFFWVNGLLQALTPVYARLQETDRRHFFFNNYLLFLALALLAGGLLFFGGTWMQPLLTGQSHVPYFEWFGAYLVLQLPAFPVEYTYLIRKQPGRILLWGVFSFGLQLAAVAAPPFLGYGLRESLLLLLALAALRFMWATGLILSNGQTVFRRDLIAQLLVFSAPLMANMAVGNLTVQFDNWLAGWWYADHTVFAVYRYGARELPLAQALSLALGVAVIPKLVESFGPGLEQLRHESRKLYHVVFPVTIVLLFISKPLFPYIFNPDFAASAPLFNIYLLIAGSRVLLPNSIVLAKGEPQAILVVGLAELTLKVALGFAGIYYWGLAGLAWSAVIGCYFEKIALGAYLYYRYGLRASHWIDLKTYRWYWAAMVVAYGLG